MHQFSRYAVLACYLLCAHHPQAQTQKVRMLTDAGEIILEVDTAKAPLTTKNFLHYVDAKRYDGAAFYRVVRINNQPDKNIKIEVIQGGLNKDSLKRFPPIAQETTQKTGILHLDGTLSMARSAPETASSEFFICINSQPELDFGGRRNPDGQGFAAFGKVIKGMDIVRRIQSGTTGENELQQVLTRPVKMITVRRIE